MKTHSGQLDHRSTRSLDAELPRPDLPLPDLPRPDLPRPDLPRPDRDDAVDALRNLNFAVQGFREAVADYFSLGVRETQAAAHLVTHGQLSAGELSRLLNLTPAAITHLLGRLERAGLATTSIDPTDQRRRVIQPTSRAQSMVDEVRTWLDSCLDSFGDSAIALTVVIDVTTTLREALNAVSASLHSSTGSAT